MLKPPRELLMRRAGKSAGYCEKPRDMLSFRRWLARRENAQYRTARR